MADTTNRGLLDDDEEGFATLAAPHSRSAGRSVETEITQLAFGEFARGEGRKFRLVVVHGPDMGQQMTLSEREPRVLIGQSPSCDVRLADRSVSRRHLSLEVQGDKLRIQDLRSSNGTTVNGVHIVEALLMGGETITLGQTQLRVDAQHGPEAKEFNSTPAVSSFGRVRGASPQMTRLYPLLRRLAATQVPVIIEGETGTGKEALAEAIHEESPRSRGPFIVFDCTAVAPNLVESELFGHEKGAYTGASGSREGVFEQAVGGTLLLDEIGDLELSLQAKLLRAVERSEVRRVGGNKTLHVDVRVLSATRRDLDAEVAAGRFRDDLFHRLCVARIELPALRNRQGDVALLARHFFRELGADESLFTPQLLARFEADLWPGNVRALRNAVARYVALGALADETRGPLSRSTQTSSPSSTPVGTNKSGPDELEEILAQDLPFVRARDLAMEQFRTRYIDRALERAGGVVTKAAEASGLARRYFQQIKAKVGK